MVLEDVYRLMVRADDFIQMISSVQITSFQDVVQVNKVWMSFFWLHVYALMTAPMTGNMELMWHFSWFLAVRGIQVEKLVDWCSREVLQWLSWYSYHDTVLELVLW